jgi:uncharacterized protein YehS (DUF1456 family)
MDNNDILKKLRVALSLKNDDIIEILSLVDFHITKGALGDFFRSPEHEGYEDGSYRAYVKKGGLSDKTSIKKQV